MTDAAADLLSMGTVLYPIHTLLSVDSLVTASWLPCPAAITKYICGVNRKLSEISKRRRKNARLKTKFGFCFGEMINDLCNYFKKVLTRTTETHNVKQSPFFYSLK